MTSLYWNGSAFAPVNKTAAKKEAVVLRLETAFKAADATLPSDTAASGICVKTDFLHSSGRHNVPFGKRRPSARCPLKPHERLRDQPLGCHLRELCRPADRHVRPARNPGRPLHRLRQRHDRHQGTAVDRHCCASCRIICSDAGRDRVILLSRAEHVNSCKPWGWLRHGCPLSHFLCSTT